MSMLFGGGRSTPNAKENVAIAGLQVQTSAYGLAIPIIFGTNRVACNLVYYDDFTAIQHVSTSSSGGKGGGGSSTQTITYTYTVDAIFGLCEGGATGIQGLGAFYLDREQFPSPAYKSYSIYLGTQTDKWPSNNNPYQYRNFAYIAATVDMGDSAQLKNHSVVVKGLEIYTDQNGAHPANIIYQLLTNPYYGISFGFFRDGVRTNTYIDSNFLSSGNTTWYNYCRASLYFFSPIIKEQQATAEILNEIVNASNGAFVWSNGKLKIIPYGEESVSNSGFNYVPTNTVQYNLTENDFIADHGVDPIRVTRKPKTDTFNQISIEFSDETIDYNSSVVEVKDDADIALYGLRKQDTLNFPFVTTKSVAQSIAQTILQRNLYVLNRFEFTLGWRYCLLEPMDLVTITDSNLGFNQKTVRVLSITENDNGQLDVVCEDFAFGSSTPAIYTPQGGGGSNVPQSISSGFVTTPRFYDPPYFLVEQSQELWIAVSGGPYWGGCDIYASVDNVNYGYIGSIYNKGRYGTTTTSLATATQELNTGQSVGVNISGSYGTLLNANTTARDVYSTAFIIENEIMSYASSQADQPAGNYTLSNFRRGLYGTTFTSHASGSSFLRLDESVFKWSIPETFVGKLVYFKFLSNNIYGKAQQTLEDVIADTNQPYTHTIPTIPLPQPYNVTITVSDNPIV